MVEPKQRRVNEAKEALEVAQDNLDKKQVGFDLVLFVFLILVVDISS